MNKLTKYTIILTTVFSISLLAGCGKKDNNQKDLVESPHTSRMKAICELATLDCYYHNVAKYDQKDATGIWIWKKDKRFWVEYSGIVTMGIDVSKLDCKVNGNNVTIVMPEAKVLSTRVDPESLTKDSFFVDKNSASVEAKDQTAAYKEAEDYMAQKAASDSVLLGNAQQQAKNLVEQYINNIGKLKGITYNISWEYLKGDEANK